MRVDVVAAQVTADLRRRVLRPHFAPGTAMPGDDVPGAVHFAARDGDTVVGACLIVPAPCPGHAGPDSWQLRGMATDAQLRGRGIGAQVLAAATGYATDRGGRLLWCNARASAVAFYARHGFVVEGEPFVTAETGIAHLRMYRELFGPPASSG